MNPTTCSIIESATYLITINSVTHGPFRVESDWNGFTKYVDEHGRFVIVYEQACVGQADGGAADTQRKPLELVGRVILASDEFLNPPPLTAGAEASNAKQS